MRTLDRRAAVPRRARIAGAAAAAGALAALALAALAGCGPARQTATETLKSVTAAKAARGAIAITLEYPARIRPRQEIVVSSKVPGRVAEVRAEVGQRVARGEVLFTLETGDYETQTRQADAALTSAKANLTRTSDSSLSSQVIQAQGSVKQAQVQYDDAKDLYERTQKLYTAGTVSRQQMESAKARYDSAGIQLDTATQSLALLQDKAGPQSTGVASSQVDQAQASADLAQSQLSNAIVTSPISGVVAARAVDAGELVSSAVPAFVIIDVTSVTAETSVEEGMVQRIARGQSVTVSVDAAGGAKLAGVVETISPAADARTQGYAVKIRIDAPGINIRPGMFARVSFPVERREGILVVPNGAVVTETGVDYVFVVVQGALRKVRVQTGLSDATVTEIVEGIDEGAAVVTEGQSFLNDGEKVTVAD
jgi:HlyD family secretion protein